ncbi:MAG: hypothetical protein ACPIOQ_02570 [Promethearchaeia archaeon]
MAGAWFWGWTAFMGARMRVLKDDGKGLARVTSIEGGNTPQTRQFRLIAALSQP